MADRYYSITIQQNSKPIGWISKNNNNYHLKITNNTQSNTWRDEKGKVLKGTTLPSIADRS